MTEYEPYRPVAQRHVLPRRRLGQETKQYVGILHIRPDLKDWLTSGKPIHFSAYAFQWLEVFAKPHLASTTYACYRQQLKKHILPAFPMRDIRSIETADIQLFSSTNAATSTTNPSASSALSST